MTEATARRTGGTCKKLWDAHALPTHATLDDETTAVSATGCGPSVCTGPLLSEEIGALTAEREQLADPVLVGPDRAPDVESARGHRLSNMYQSSNWAIVVLNARVFNSSNDNPTSSCEKTSTAQGPV